MAKEIDEKSKELDENVVEEKTIDTTEIDEKLKLLDEKLKELDEKTAAYDKKVAEVEAKLPALTDKELVESAKRIGEELNKMEKVHVRIPIDEKNKADKFVPVTISGYTFQIERGVSVEVPKEVERLLIEAKYI